MSRLVWMDTRAEVPSIEMTLDLRTHLTVWLGRRLAPTVYWQLSDSDFSLLEIGLDRATGLLTKVTIPLYRGEIGRLNTVGARLGVQGMPQFDLAGWPPASRSTADDFKEIAGRIRIDANADGWWTITMFDEAIVHDVGVPDWMFCGLNSRKELCRLSVNVTRSHGSLPAS